MKTRIRNTSKNPIPRLRRKLTKVFNEFIRLRDAKLGCISCVIGGVENAGHFHGRGKEPHPSLAFDERNVNGQCVRCNYTLSGNQDGYEKGLLKKYGPTILIKLEVKRSVRQNPWTRFEYETMIEHYKNKLKAFKGVKCERKID